MKNREFSGKFNKFALGALVASSIVSSVCANGLFVGVDGEYNFNSKFDYKQNIVSVGTSSSETVNYKDSSFGIGLKFGYDFDLWRIHTKFNAVLGAKDEQNLPVIGGINEYKWDTYNLVVGGDWTPKINLFDQNFKGVLGVFAGVSYLVLESNLSGGMISNSDEGNGGGFIYGAKIGGIYGINKNSEIEFGLKIDQVNYERSSSSPMSNNELKYKITNMGVFVGYNYKF